MTTRRRFLTATASTLAATTLRAPAANPKPLFSFGLMADCQYADAKPAGIRFYRESPRKLGEAIDAFNDLPLAFTFHLGDWIDRDFASFDTLEPIAARLESKLYHALGNHDFDVPEEQKPLVPAKLGLTGGHYSFRRDSHRFIVIDTTDVSVYRHPKDSDEHRAAEAAMKKAAAEGSKSAKTWNSRPGAAQLAWLEAELKAAGAAKETVVVLGHHPILPNGGHSIWNAGAVDRLLQKHPCVKAYINGHNHAGAYTDEEGLHYLTLDGMLNTKDENAYAFADVYPDRLEVTGFGRQESHSLKFR